METQRVDVAILLFEGLTALDAIGPFEVLQWAPGARILWVARAPGPVRTERGRLALTAEHALNDVPATDVLVVPGGPGQAAVMEDREILDWVRQVHATTRWTTSVCTGGLVLGGAGLLRGVRATTHWLALDTLADYGAVPTRERVVRDGKIVTSAGVSAGIDMALTLVGLEWGPERAQAIQLGIEYDPRPPFDAGSPLKASPEIVEGHRRRSRFRTS